MITSRIFYTYLIRVQYFLVQTPCMVNLLFLVPISKTPYGMFRFYHKHNGAFWILKVNGKKGLSLYITPIVLEIFLV